MKTIKRILILCDAQDCIRHEGNNQLLLKQLYVTVFLLKKYFSDDDFTLHINNRGYVGFEDFWEETHDFYSFMTPHIRDNSWKDIEMFTYDLIIVHPDYQNELRQHLQLFEEFDDRAVYAFSELQYRCEMLYKRAEELFSKNGIFEFNQNKHGVTDLITFKQNFDDAICRLNIELQETKIPQFEQMLNRRQGPIKLEHIKSVLILDDYKRPFFIGDSVHWLSKIRKLLGVLPNHDDVDLNINHQAAFDCTANLFQKSVSDRIHFTNISWVDLNLEKYDIILCNNDILLKFCWFVREYHGSLYEGLLFYSFSVMDERPSLNRLTIDFYNHILQHTHSEQIHGSVAAPVCNELLLLKEEELWANKWLIERGVQDSEDLIILIHGASAPDKVIYDVELLKFIEKLSILSENIKILLVTEKEISHYVWLNEVISSREYPNVIVADALGLREVMSLFVDKKIAAVIGPCTGLMHLADGVYSYLINHKIIEEFECPLLITYAGKQTPERYYHPNRWWKDSELVTCIVNMRMIDGSDDKQLVLLEDCPGDLQAFNQKSINARDICGNMLIQFITEKFPKFNERVSSKNIDHSTLNFQDLSVIKKRIPTYIISLEHRIDRRNHILKQFEDKPAFDCTLVNAIEYVNGSLGLWHTIKNLVLRGVDLDSEYILICEDDHLFSIEYSDETLFSSINDAMLLKADILLGGICFCDQSAKQVQNNLLSVVNFACTQFIIIFKSLYQKILTAEFAENDCVDFKISELSDKKLVMYPFISTQKDFGYSDVSNGYYDNKMSTSFHETSEVIKNIIKSEKRFT
ncbi:hypothetical protein [Pedobacter antarcticus]|uniref:hypothetical protein n=1 Tax=Pedobacter antarcticus TaxID=34086 RepID=UPI0029307353|nr:hypothetical protein [Pedobacter antarcticus]